MKTLAFLFVLFSGYFSSAKALQFSLPDTSQTAISKDSAQQLLEVVIHDDPWDDKTRATIKMCINAGANPDTRYGSISWTLLIGAADDGNTDLAEFLINKGAEVNFSDADGSGPLQQAVYRGHKEMVKLLLKHKASVNSIDNFGRTPWDLTNDKEIQKLLKSKGGKPASKLKKH